MIHAWVAETPSGVFFKDGDGRRARTFLTGNLQRPNVSRRTCRYCSDLQIQNFNPLPNDFTSLLPASGHLDGQPNIPLDSISAESEGEALVRCGPRAL